MIRFAAAFLAVVLLHGHGVRAEPIFEDRDIAFLGGMEKVTGHASSFGVAVGETGHFGTLQVTVRACRTTPPWQAPESASFLEISDIRSGEPESVFTGWMFAGTPGVSALEHPVYDIWVLDCADRASE